MNTERSGWTIFQSKKLIRKEKSIGPKKNTRKSANPGSRKMIAGIKSE
jgi:hypothetical protein